MKIFFSVVVLAASVTPILAQVTYNSSTGVFSCPVPNGAYCAGDSLETNIIIRCVDGVGHPGNCNDNLAGQVPQGVNFSPCWEASTTSGQAACSKNCVVYGSSGNFNGTFTLPGCTPEVTPSSSVAVSTVPTTTTFSTITSSSKPTYGTGISTVPSPITTPVGTGIPTAPGPIVSSGSSGLPHGTNGTATITASTYTQGSGSATATPISPTSTRTGATPSFTGGAAVNAGTCLAGLGLIVAYFL